MSKEDLLKAKEVKASLDVVADKVFAYGRAKNSDRDTVEPKRDVINQKRKRR